MRFAPKRDGWAVGIAGGLSVAYLALAAILAAFLAPSAPGVLIVVGCLAGTAALLLWCLLGTSYEITAAEVVVRVGPFRKRLPLGSIAEVRAVRTMWQPAWNFSWSLDRLLLYRRKPNGMLARLPVSISPHDKSGFVRELVANRPELAGLAVDLND